MLVYIKQFDVGMEIKNRGIELEVRDTSGRQLGDLVITKAKLTWCKGRTAREHGISVQWREFINWMEGP